MLFLREYHRHFCVWDMVRLEPAIDQPSAEDHLRFLFRQRFVLCVQRAVLLVIHRIVELVAGMPFAGILMALLQQFRFPAFDNGQCRFNRRRGASGFQHALQLLSLVHPALFLLLSLPSDIRVRKHADFVGTAGQLFSEQEYLTRYVYTFA